MRDEPIKHRHEYEPAWDAAINKFTAQFIEEFCYSDGSIDWEKLVRFVSETSPPKETEKKPGKKK